MRALKIVMAAGALSGLAACVNVAVDAPAAPVAAAAPAATAELTRAQAEVFGPLAGLVGTRWRGEPLGDSSEQQVDYQSWEWALDGSAILVRHAIADGSYGGDTYIYPGASGGPLTYVYITNAGFYTEGTYVFGEDGSWTAEEDVKGHPEITRVRSTGTRNDDGSLTVEGSYLTNGTWQPGHGFVYRETDAALPTLNALGTLTAK